MKSKMKLAVLVAALGFSASAMAAEKMNEVSVSGNITSTTSGSGANKSTTDSVSVFGAYGYYFSPQLVGQIGVGVTGSSYGSSSSSAALVLGFGAKYYFANAHSGDIVPFAGGRLDLLSTSSTSSGRTYDGSGTQITGFVGASDFLSETASLDLILSLSAGSVTVSGTSSDYSTTKLEIGFTQRF